MNVLSQKNSCDQINVLCFTQIHRVYRIATSFILGVRSLGQVYTAPMRQLGAKREWLTRNSRAESVVLTSDSCCCCTKFSEHTHRPSLNVLLRSSLILRNASDFPYFGNPGLEANPGLRQCGGGHCRAVPLLLSHQAEVKRVLIIK